MITMNRLNQKLVGLLIGGLAIAIAGVLPAPNERFSHVPSAVPGA